MKRFLALFLVLAMLLTVLPAATLAAESDSVEFTILSTTDIHGKCWDTNVLNGATESNNMLKISTAVKQIREANDNVLLIDNGDLYQGTPVSSYQLSLKQQGLSDLPAAMAVCLEHMGYDFSGLGNHEFNYAWSLMEDARSYLAENGIPTVCANLYYDGSDGVHAAGENVFTPYITKEITVGDETLTIGLLGLVTTDCTRWDIPDNYPGMVFAHPENTDLSMAWEAQRYIPQMKEDGCDFIIAVYHSGLGTTTGDLVFGTNTENQVARMVAACSDIGMVIAGHDHSTGYSNTYLKDLDGDDVLVVNGGGTQLTDTTFVATSNGDGTFSFTVKSTKNIAVGSYASDAELQAKMQPYATLAEEYVNQSAGKAIGTWDTVTNYYLQQSDTIDLINRAQIEMGTKYLQEAYAEEEAKAALFEETGLDHLEVDLSSTSVVVNNKYTVQPGDITMKNIYQMYRYDNNLYLLAMTGAEIKAALEFNAENHLKATVVNGKVNYTTIGEDFTNPVFGGLIFTYDMAQEPGSRVVIEGFNNGRAFDLEATYVVAVNNYHLGNVGCYFGNYSTDDAIWSQTDDLGGGVVQDLIYAFIQEQTAENGGVSPFKYSWKLDYTGSLEDTGITGDVVGKLADGVADGDEIIIYYNAESTVLGASASENASSIAAVDASISGSYIGTSHEAGVYTVEMVDAENGYFALKTEDGYLTSGEAGNSLSFQEELTECGQWYLVAVEGGFHIMNVGANFQGSHNQALEYYYGFTTYGVKDDPRYLFNLFKVVETASLASELVDGGKYVIYYDAEGLSLATTVSGGGLGSVVNTVSGTKMLLPLAENTLVVTANITDGQIDFVTEDGLHLTSAASGNGLALTEEATECSLWTLTAVEGGWHVMNAGAAYQGSHNQALEYYSGCFTTYGVQDDSKYLFNFYALPDSSEPEDPCANGHTWDEGVVTTPATCKEEGVLTYTCTVCGETKTEAIAKTEHTWDAGVVTTPATCKEEGVLTYTCTVCGETKTEAIAKTEHTWDAGAVTTPATCTEEGVLTYTCTVCGETRTEVIAATGHDYQGVFVAPTYFEGGYVEYTCANCGDHYQAFQCQKLVPGTTFTGVMQEKEDWTGVYALVGYDLVFYEGSPYITDILLLAEGAEGSASQDSFADNYNMDDDSISNVSVTYAYYFERLENGRYHIISIDSGKYLSNGYGSVAFEETPSANSEWVIETDQDGYLLIYNDNGGNSYYLIYNYAEYRFEVRTGDYNGYGNVEDLFWIDLYEMNPRFTDLKPNAWYESAVEFAASEGLFYGNEKHEFMPGKYMTRAELVNVLYNLAGAPEVEYTDTFTDVLEGEWYSKAVIWAASNKIVSGIGNDKFNPKGNVTREQIAVIMQNYTIWAGGDVSARADLTGFPDESSISGWASEAIAWANAEGIISGQANGGQTLLNPTGNATRAEVASILMRYVLNCVWAANHPIVNE